MAHLKGKPAPAISGVKDQHGVAFDSSSVFGKQPVVLFFYPAAMTTGCTKEACSLRDVNNGPTFAKADKSPLMRIIGISSDTVARQKEFADKYDLNYTLLADTDKRVREAYGVGGRALLGIAAQRVTFIIDGKGIIRDTEDSSINMKAHTKIVERWVPILKSEQAETQGAKFSASETNGAQIPTATAPVPSTTGTAAAPAPAATASA